MSVNKDTTTAIHWHFVIIRMVILTVHAMMDTLGMEATAEVWYSFLFLSKLFELLALSSLSNMNWRYLLQF